MKKSLSTLFVLLLLPVWLGLLMLCAGSCTKRDNTQPQNLPNRVVSQTEIFRGNVESTATFRYQNDRIVHRDYITPTNQIKYDFEYSADQVISYYSRKYRGEWYNTSSTVFNYNAGQLIEVLYRDFDDNDWEVHVKWSFLYDGNNYDEILMEEVVNGKSTPDSKITYEYNADTLNFYTIYNFDDGWQVNREVKFDYLEGRIDVITLSYAWLGFEFGPQEQHNYYYTGAYNTRVGTSVRIDTGWVERSEILRSYDISGNMIDETVQSIGDATNAYRYEYSYELGRENFDIFPFYDQPLFEYIYPTPNPGETYAKPGLFRSWKPIVDKFSKFR